jgi:hypothetical protein
VPLVVGGVIGAVLLVEIGEQRDALVNGGVGGQVEDEWLHLGA